MRKSQVIQENINNSLLNIITPIGLQIKRNSLLCMKIDLKLIMMKKKVS